MNWISNDIKMLMLMFLLHFIGNFLLQSRKTAHNKSKDIIELFKHSFIYGCCYSFISDGFFFIMMTSHFIIDFVTSKIISYFRKNDKEWLFFVTIGFDQFIHSIIIIILWNILVNPMKYIPYKDEILNIFMIVLCVITCICIYKIGTTNRNIHIEEQKTGN